MAVPINPEAEWMESDGLGGYACGTVAGYRTRRQHALLCAGSDTKGERIVLVNGLDVWVETPEGVHGLASQIYAPDVLHPDGAQWIEGFERHPWPTWRFHLPGGVAIEQELLAIRGMPVCAIRWRLVEKRPDVSLRARPLLSGRPKDGLHEENDDFNFGVQTRSGWVRWQPYAAWPAVVAVTNANYSHQPEWYRRFLYRRERDAGLDHLEDLASPGVMRWDLSRGDAVLLLGVENLQLAHLPHTFDAEAMFLDVREAERARRAKIDDPILCAAEAYVTRHPDGRCALMVGYPWCAGRPRQVFIALRGLCLAAGRLEDAETILRTYVPPMLHGAPDDAPDSALWYLIALHEWVEATRRSDPSALETDPWWRNVITTVVASYIEGTRPGARLDDDGLLCVGETDRAATWMNTRVGDDLVTPRTGKPVEVEALWLNALWIARELDPTYVGFYERGLAAFSERFWNDERGCLFDVVDADGKPGVCDAAVRPNQVFAVGGLPKALIEGERAARIVERIECDLLTPIGLRSLAPDEADYVGRWRGTQRERDLARHQGSAWPWLTAAFVEAWLRVRGATDAARTEARRRFFEPLIHVCEEDGLGHLPELADGDAPHNGGGAPFCGLSVGELIRLRNRVE